MLQQLGWVRDMATCACLCWVLCSGQEELLQRLLLDNWQAAFFCLLGMLLASVRLLDRLLLIYQ